MGPSAEEEEPGLARLGELDFGSCLGIFDRASVEGKLPYYWYLNAKDRKQFDENWPGIVQWYTDRIREFAASQPGKPRPIVYTLPDAPHYFYFNDQAFVVRVMREFLLHKDSPR